MLLLIDNYDSFTYNLYQFLCELGADVRVVRNDAATLDEIEQMAPERIVISPGPCTPEEAGISTDVVRRFRGAHAHPGRLSWPSVHRGGVRRLRERRGRDRPR